LDYFEDEKRELYQKIELLQERSLFLEQKIKEADLVHENDQRSIAKTYKQIKEIEDDLKVLKEEMTNKKEQQRESLKNNDLIIGLRDELEKARFKISKLEGENSKLERKSNRVKDEMMTSLTSEYRSISNLITLFDTTSIALSDSKDMMENIKSFFTPSSNKTNDMEQSWFYYWRE